MSVCRHRTARGWELCRYGLYDGVISLLRARVMVCGRFVYCVGSEWAQETTQRAYPFAGLARLGAWWLVRSHKEAGYLLSYSVGFSLGAGKGATQSVIEASMAEGRRRNVQAALATGGDFLWVLLLRPFALPGSLGRDELRDELMANGAAASGVSDAYLIAVSAGAKEALGSSWSIWEGLYVIGRAWEGAGGEDAAVLLDMLETHGLIPLMSGAGEELGLHAKGIIDSVRTLMRADSLDE